MTTTFDELEKRVAALEKSAHDHGRCEGAKLNTSMLFKEINKRWKQRENQSLSPGLEQKSS